MGDRWHFHERGVIVPEGSNTMERLAHGEVVPVISEGYWKVDLQFPSPLFQKKITDRSLLYVGDAQAVGVIPARMSRMHLFEVLPIWKLINSLGYETVSELQEGLFELYRPKPFIDWFSIIFFIDKKMSPKPVMEVTIIIYPIP